MMTSDRAKQEQHRLYLHQRAERLSRRLFARSLERLPLGEWRRVWQLVDEDERRAEGQQ